MRSFKQLPSIFRVVPCGVSRFALRADVFVVMSLTFVLTLCVSVTSALAQTSSPDRVVTPAEHARFLELYPSLIVVSEDGNQRITGDQRDSLLKQRMSAWVASLQARPVKGIQLDPMGKLYVTIGQDELAKKQFEARLSTPGLSVHDRAYTLLLAVGAFGGKPGNTVRMQTALDYLKQLDALPESVTDFKIFGHSFLGRSYYYVGDGTRASVHLKRAISLLPSMPFESRNRVDDVFLLTADVLSGRPNGRAQIDSIATWVLSHLRTPAELVAKDSAYYWIGRGMEQSFKRRVRLVSHLGRQAPVITAHFWLNTPAPATPSPEAGAAVKALNDGKIRVIEFGHMGCGGCQAALPVMEEMSKQTPSNVEMWYVANEGDSWGTTACKPSDCFQHLKHHYTGRKQRFGFPMAFWIGPRTSDVDGGTLQQESPTFKALEVATQPLFIVTDGKGIVRHIQEGLTRDLIERTVQYLAAEAKQSAQL